jgi:sugar/nucleoside kinase (ribokinase family)
MCTSLGIGAFLDATDADRASAAIQGARILYLEGYLCGKPESESGVERAIAIGREAGTLVAFSGSDPAWVALHLAELTQLLDRVDILFANEEEALRLAGANSLDEALDRLNRRCPTVAITLGAHGSVVASDGTVASVPAVPVTAVVDTTGAGDSFAAGFLYGVVNGMAPERCARIGAVAAAEVISHVGARPLSGLADRARAAGLI